MFAISSDRGLCGGIHSGMAKAIKAKMETKSSGCNPMIIICGDKVRGILQRTHGRSMLNIMQHNYQFNKVALFLSVNTFQEVLLMFFLEKCFKIN